MAFSIPEFRASAFGYFGHQWELYAFWTLVPILVLQGGLAGSPGSVAGLSFAIVGIGALGCFAGGTLSHRIGSARVAALALAVSALCCLLYPWVVGARRCWCLQCCCCGVFGGGRFAPLFRALGARLSAEIVGSALAFQNAIGFAITMVSIAWGTRLVGDWGASIAWLLLPGPLLGLVGLSPLWRKPVPA